MRDATANWSTPSLASRRWQCLDRRGGNQEDRKHQDEDKYQGVSCFSGENGQPQTAADAREAGLQVEKELRSIRKPLAK